MAASYRETEYKGLMKYQLLIINIIIKKKSWFTLLVNILKSNAQMHSDEINLILKLILFSFWLSGVITTCSLEAKSDLDPYLQHRSESHRQLIYCEAYPTVGLESYL